VIASFKQMLKKQKENQDRVDKRSILVEQGSISHYTSLSLFSVLKELFWFWDYGVAVGNCLSSLVHN